MCAGCTSILTQSPCLPAERGAGTEQDVSIHAAHPTCRKSPFLQHNPTCRARALPRLGLQQSGVPFAPFPDRNPYPKGDFYPVFHALLQHKCLLLVAFQIAYRNRRGLLRAPLCCAVFWGEFRWPEQLGQELQGPLCCRSQASNALATGHCKHNSAINSRLFLCRCLLQDCHHLKAAMNVTMQAGRICLPHLAPHTSTRHPGVTELLLGSRYRTRWGPSTVLCCQPF